MKRHSWNDLRLSVFGQCVAQRLKGDVVRPLQLSHCPLAVGQRTFQVRHGSVEKVGPGLDEGFQFVLVCEILQLQPALFQSPGHNRQELLALERLQEVVVGTHTNGFERHRNIVNPRDHNDGYLGVIAMGIFQQGEPVASGHEQVAEDQRVALGRHHGNGGIRRGCLLHGIAGRL